MTTEEIRKLVDEVEAEKLTSQVCRHWEVAAQRLACLDQELADGMDTCVEAEVYAAMMRMQSAVMALMALNKIPTAFLFSEYLDRIADSVSNASLRQSVLSLMNRMPKQASDGKQTKAFFDTLIQSLKQLMAMSPDMQAAARQKAAPMQHILSVCGQHLKPGDLMTVAQVIQNINTAGEAENGDEQVDMIQDMRQTMESLDSQMGNSLQTMLIGLLPLMLLPSLMVSMMRQRRTDSKAMAQLFNKVLMRVRNSNTWWHYWREYRETLRVVSDSSSMKEIWTDERTKERAELGLVPGGLFAKWTTDRKNFDAYFLEAHLDDDALRHFIFHLTSLYEIARELDPGTKVGEEQLVQNDLQCVGEAVLEAANKLSDLVAKAWQSQYDAMWQELIQNETIFAHLKVTRKSPHNNQFTTRFFCHLVGELKKSAVFGAHSDNDLAEKLTGTQSVATFRKNIQEGMGKEEENVQQIFKAIYQKYNRLAHPKR